MKIKPDRYDESELVVPKTIEDVYRADIKKYPEEYEDFIDWWLEKGKELFLGKEGPDLQFVSKEIAEFAVSMELGLISHLSGGESSIEGRSEFKDNGYKYTIYAYTSAGEIEYLGMNMIGVKEKIGEEEEEKVMKNEN